MDRAKELAAAAANDLVGELMPALQGAMETGGPREAVTVCAEQAQVLTSEVQTRHEGVRIRRTSLSARNPANAPDEWELAWMERFNAQPADATPIVSSTHLVSDAAGQVEVRHVRPLLVAEMCLTCHGPTDQIDPGVLALIQDRYPDDVATGFNAGDLRGIISVRVPIE